MAVTQTTVDKPQRAFASHTPKWQRFQTKVVAPSTKTTDTNVSPYQRQYSHVYAQRLAMLKPKCWESVPEEVQRVSRVLDLREDTPCAVVGTLVKECQDTSEETLSEKSECRKSDVLILEDESGRVTLSTERVHEWCTGVVVAVQGVVKEGGILHVEAFYPPKASPTPTSTGQLTAPSNNTEMDPHVLLVSGFNCGAPDVCSLTRDMLLGYLEGLVTPEASKICRVVIAGGSASSTAFGVQELDGWIAQVCAAGIPVDLLPGQHDPTTANWPQRPLHSSLLKYSGSFLSKDLLSRTPNPYASELGDKFVIGTDGRNVSDLQTHLFKEKPYEPIEALRATLNWSHLCPTGPSSVPTVPHEEVDPMVMTETPHLLFAGNCDGFATDKVGDTRLVCIPKFAETGEVVLVNLKTLDCERVRFDDQA